MTNEIFLAVLLFIGGVIATFASPLVSQEQAKKIVRYLGIIAVAVSLIWLGFNLERPASDQQTPTISQLTQGPDPTRTFTATPTLAPVSTDTPSPTSTDTPTLTSTSTPTPLPTVILEIPSLTIERPLNADFTHTYSFIRNGLLLHEVEVYDDRNFRISSAPSCLSGQLMLQTVNGDKRYGAENEQLEISFNVNRDVRVLVAFDDRFSANEVPAWLEVYEPITHPEAFLRVRVPVLDNDGLHQQNSDTGEYLYESGDQGSFVLYSKFVEANELVELGPNMTPNTAPGDPRDQKGMYFVILDIGYQCDF